MLLLMKCLVVGLGAMSRAGWEAGGKGRDVGGETQARFCWG